MGTRDGEQQRRKCGEVKGGRSKEKGKEMRERDKLPHEHLFFPTSN